MNFFSKLGLITELPEEVKQDKVSEVKSEKNVQVEQVLSTKEKKATISFAPPAASLNSGQVIGKFDNEISEKLSVAIEDNNLKGNDFLEFMQSLNKMAGLSVDEKTKFNMVFATLTTSDGGLTKEYLMSSIEHYIGVIGNEKEIFRNEMSKASVEMVTNREASVEQLSISAQEKAEQIQKLQQEIQEISENVTVSKSEIEQSKLVIAQKQADFDVTVNLLETQILDYKTKIEQHIQ